MQVPEPTKVEITPATAEDVAPFFGGLPPYRLRAWVGKVEGTAIGTGGLYYLPDGTRIGFLILGEDGKRYPKVVLKAAYRFLDQLRQEGVQSIRAVADPAIAAAERFLLHIGFTPLFSEHGYTVYQWTP